MFLLFKLARKIFKFLIVIVGLQMFFSAIQPKVSLDSAEVIRVIDGDTLVVMYQNVETTIRLIGVDTPESVNPDTSKNTKWGEEASKYTKSLVSPGDIVYLEKDKTDLDKYGRYLRYVWLKEPSQLNSAYAVKNDMLNGILVSQGYAIAKEYKPNTKYSEYLKIYTNAAKEEQEGLWADKSFVKSVSN